MSTVELPTAHCLPSTINQIAKEQPLAGLTSESKAERPSKLDQYTKTGVHFKAKNGRAPDG